MKWPQENTDSTWKQNSSDLCYFTCHAHGVWIYFPSNQTKLHSYIKQTQRTLAHTYKQNIVFKLLVQMQYLSFFLKQKAYYKYSATSAFDTHAGDPLFAILFSLQPGSFPVALPTTQALNPLPKTPAFLWNLSKGTFQFLHYILCCNSHQLPSISSLPRDKEERTLRVQLTIASCPKICGLGGTLPQLFLCKARPATVPAGEEIGATEPGSCLCTQLYFCT